MREKGIRFHKELQLIHKHYTVGLFVNNPTNLNK